jgi:aminoglycoside 3-N-acetyltransferase
VNETDLVRDLRALGIREGDRVLAHTSLSHIGHVDGGAPTVVQALLDAVGPEGTLVFPAHTWSPDYSPANPPKFDVRSTPVIRAIGVIPEAARVRTDALRSLHPTHSVTAFGRLAAWIVEGHDRCEAPCGIGTPYAKIAAVGGKILLLGCEHHSNTSLHGVEEEAGLAYHLLPGFGDAELTDEAGVVRKVPMRYHRWGVDRDFMRIDRDLSELGIQTIGFVGKAESRLVDARGMWAFVLERVARDPGALLPEGYAIPPLTAAKDGS